VVHGAASAGIASETPDFSAVVSGWLETLEIDRAIRDSDEA